MAQNRTRKTMRHFQCRDDLWGLFEKMAVELECSIDYLINEAMRQYARARKYASPQPGRESSIPPEIPATVPQAMPPVVQPTIPSGGQIRQIAPPPAGQRISAPPPRPPMAATPPPAGQVQGSFPMPGKQSIPPAAGVPFGTGSMAPTITRQPQQVATPIRPTMDTDPFGRSAPPSAPPMQPSGVFPPQQFPGAVAPSIPHTAGTVPTLYLIFNGQRIPITKEQFIIGRGLKTSDLAIKDGNISRKHAAIIYHNGAYYIKDLGSVNGIEFAGKRIDSKKIDEGDVFHICDYELKFTFK